MVENQVAGASDKVQYLIRKNGYYYRPNAQGYTNVEAEAGRFSLEDAIAYSHPNGPDGPRDGIRYEPAPDKALMPDDAVGDADIKALLADKARLDYLDRCNIALNAQSGSKYGWTLIQNHNVNRLMLDHMSVDLNDMAAQGLPSCRAAIDQKMGTRTTPTPLEPAPGYHRRAPVEELEKGAAGEERAVMVCPQCEGEGSYADGLDEAACSTECTRCGSNGWIVDLAALARTKSLTSTEEG